MQKIFFLSLALLAVFAAFSQEKRADEPLKIGYIYGASVHNRGLSGNFGVYFGKNPLKWVIRLDASTLKNTKETRIRSIYMDLKEGSRFVYDKMNRFAVICPTFGVRKAIIPFSAYNKVAVIGEITSGLVIGLMRPYYLNVSVPDSMSPGLYNIEATQWNPVTYTYLDVLGESNVFRKLSPSKVYAGWCVHATAYIDMSRKAGLIRGIQLNIDANLFAKKIPIMNVSPNTASFLTAGIGMCFGVK